MDDDAGLADDTVDSFAQPRIRWGIARSAALVFLGVALAVGAALFLVRSSEPSAAAVTVELDAGEHGTVDSEPPTRGSAGEQSGTGPAEGSGAEPRSEEADGEVDGTAGAASSGSPADVGGASGSAEGVEVVVYVTGAVSSPGVVSVPSGTRLVDVLERAGGPLPEADLEGINLAGVPVDGQHIHVVMVGEAPRADGGDQPGAPPAAAAPTGTSGSTSAGTVGGAAGGTTGTGPGEVIDINTATLAEIEALPRVGPVLGQRIIEWRQTQGPFARAADIDAVPGIGPALLEGILPLITVR